jgi:dTDP-4-dehydrorhamnose 3,5-epimerase-like enzyme
MILLPQLIEIEKIDFEADGFSINAFELTKICPFEVKRVYTLISSDKTSIRGNHAHMNQSQMLYLLHGKAEMKLTDQSGAESHWIMSAKCLLVPSSYWIELSMAANTTILCFASQPYSDLETIFDKDVFLNSGK